METALRESRADIRLLRLAHIAYRHNGQAREADAILATIARIASYRRIEYIGGPEVVALGQSLLELGGEPRLVLEHFYTWAMKNDPNCREAYLAAGALALAKQDFELAADQYRDALKRFGNDPDAQFGLAQAFYHSNRSEMIAALDAAFVVNPRHAPSLILLAEHQIDCEDYEGAAKSLDRVLAVNPWHPQAWAYRAVLAHLANDPNAAESHRANGLKFWPDQSGGGLPDRPQALAELSVHRRGGLPASGDQGQPDLPARPNPTGPGPAPTRRRGTRLGPGRRGEQERSLQRRGLQPHPPS